ncbi:PREDICTED: oral cancer-overexpressed protein 1 isoform X5 [Rhinopithecus bieti]|uniref:oral cancer-overexpressed protein 1 isoform X5 n=1 Tax=Rhinopithecus bieti TaxID=61621 RepID=UPI00083C0B24|nr:PREDICTED: oral cancer-overexpressed protein 1 isoform X5 [Rhinopithecus bieti]
MAGSQDIFDSIVMADERFHAEGYREGYEEGSSLGVTEGRQHGTLHGAKIGSEWQEKNEEIRKKGREAYLPGGCCWPTLYRDYPPVLEAGLPPSLCRDTEDKSSGHSKWPTSGLTGHNRA